MPPDAPIPTAEVARALQNRDAILRRLDKLDAEEKFLDYIKLMWYVRHSETSDKFQCGWFLEGLCEHLEAVTRGEIKKLLINCPPGSGKSIVVPQLWPSWEWGPKNLPHLCYICATHTFNIACDHNRNTREYIESELYQELWGDRFTLVSDANAKQRFANDKAGQKLAIGTEGSLTGERAHRVIVDDPHTVADADSEIVLKSQVQWYFETASSRNKNPKDPTHIITMQRLGINDLSGKILSQANALGWEHYCIEMEFDPHHPIARKRMSRIGWTDPRADRYWAQHAAYEKAQAILKDARRTDDARRAAAQVEPPEAGELAFPERFDAAAVESQKADWRATRGPYVESAQMQQNPIPEVGGMFDAEKYQVVELSAVPVSLRAPWARGWDFAGSTTERSPYTAGALGRIINGQIFIYDMVHQRVESALLDKLLRETAEMDDATRDQKVIQDFPQDPGQAGKGQVRHIAAMVLQGHDFASSTEGRLDKVARARPFAAQWNAGNVFLVRGHWNEPFKQEVLAFPGGTYKDQVDAVVRMYNRLLMRKTQKLPGAGMTVETDRSEDEEAYA